MKRILVAMVIVLMSAGTAMAHGGVNFQIGVGIPLSYPYSYSTYYNPTYYYLTYYYPTPYGYHYRSPHVVYGYHPYYGKTYLHRGHDHRNFIDRRDRFHNDHFRFRHDRRFGR
jgi:hypothetical protein